MEYSRPGYRTTLLQGVSSIYWITLPLSQHMPNESSLISPAAAAAQDCRRGLRVLVALPDNLHVAAFVLREDREAYPRFFQLPMLVPGLGPVVVELECPAALRHAAGESVGLHSGLWGRTFRNLVRRK